MLSLELKMLRGLWVYRGFIVGSVVREFQMKYRNSLLGALWNILNPLAMILVYTLIFAEVMHARLQGREGTYAYGIYLCSGLLTWGLFAEVVGRSQGVFIEYAELLKKISFPRLCLPAIVLLSALQNFLIVFGLFSLFLLLTGNFPVRAFPAMLPLLALQLLFSIGLGITLGVLNVFFRDVGQMVGVLLQFWFWLTPIVYSIHILPAWAQREIYWNPLAPLMLAYQRVLLDDRWPEWSSLMGLLGLSLLFCLLGLYLFRKHAADMVDEL
jgi:ABC-type polysaccharide/polyol phosphate export systems, permease component